MLYKKLNDNQTLIKNNCIYQSEADFFRNPKVFSLRINIRKNYSMFVSFIFKLKNNIFKKYKYEKAENYLKIRKKRF